MELPQTELQSSEPQIMSLVPDPSPVELLTAENNNLKELITGLEDQVASNQAQIKVLEQHKAEILERLKSHEDNSFALVMANLSHGDTALNLHREIVRISDLVGERWAPGKVSVNLTIKPTDEGAYGITAEIKATEPKTKQMASVFFKGENGKLSRNSQRQSELPI